MGTSIITQSVERDINNSLSECEQKSEVETAVEMAQCTMDELQIPDVAIQPDRLNSYLAETANYCAHDYQDPTQDERQEFSECFRNRLGVDQD